MRVGREDFLLKLNTVRAGLSGREIIEQSSCFVFSKGEVATFNDEVSCRGPSGLPDDFKGAVTAKPLLSLLERLSETEVEVQLEKDQLLVVGKNRRAGVRAEAEILLPLGSVETPKKWRDLHADFAEALSLVMNCASSDTTRFILTCVHIHPEWVEACDHHQLSRYRLDTGVTAPLLVRRDSLKQVAPLGVTEVGVSPAWVHFRNPSGLILSCRRHVDDYPDLAPLLKVKGTPTTLPKGLSEACANAEVFSSENTDRNVIVVELRSGKLRVKGTGALGWYSEVKKLKYSGPALKFMVDPQLLAELVKKYNDCEITGERLKVDGGAYTYVSWLFKADEGNGEEPTEEGE
jgi:hypothetical protein